MIRISNKLTFMIWLIFIEVFIRQYLMIMCKFHFYLWNLSNNDIHLGEVAEYEDWQRICVSVKWWCHFMEDKWVVRDTSSPGGPSCHASMCVNLNYHNNIIVTLAGCKICQVYYVTCLKVIAFVDINRPLRNFVILHANYAHEQVSVCWTKPDTPSRCCTAVPCLSMNNNED